MDTEPSNFQAVVLHESAHFVAALHHEQAYGDLMPFQAICVRPAPFHDMWLGVCHGRQNVASVLIPQSHDAIRRWMIMCAAG